MLFPVIIMGLIIAIIFSLIFSLGFKQNNRGIKTPVFFLIIFLTVSSAGLLMTSGEYTVWTMSWSYLFFIALVVSILLAAKSGRRARTQKEVRIAMQEEKRTSAFINIFLWSAIIVFMVLIAFRTN